MGQKQSSSATDTDIPMMDRTDLSSHFTEVMSKSYQADDCFNCGARLEDNNSLYSGTKPAENVVQCRQCRVCNSTNVIFEKFRDVVMSSSHSLKIRHSMSGECQIFGSQTRYHNHHVRSNPSVETVCGSPNNTSLRATSGCV